jgi:hypothetical protein
MAMFMVAAAYATDFLHAFTYDARGGLMRNRSSIQVNAFTWFRGQSAQTLMRQCTNKKEEHRHKKTPPRAGFEETKMR